MFRVVRTGVRVILCIQLTHSQIVCVCASSTTFSDQLTKMIVDVVLPPWGVGAMFAKIRLLHSTASSPARTRRLHYATFICRFNLI